MISEQFSQTLIDWQKVHGRHHLPWQYAHPYARWISEIMLQQTQVATVIEYYDRFMKRFPTVQSLAESSEDEVMQYWSGLGYYSRARNLHKSAKIIVYDHKGVFPTTRLEWESLPGVGRSTAAAIVAFSFGAKETILDGNVKRVLMRYFCLDAPIDNGETTKKLWDLAENLLPQNDIEAYIQGLMDLGATVCTRTPKCVICPFRETCQALLNGKQGDIPAPRKKLNRLVKERTFFLLWHEDGCLLQKRSTRGVWRGLFSLPEREGEMSEEDILEVLSAQGFMIKNIRRLESFHHDFSHYRLVLHPWAIHIKNPAVKSDERWAKVAELPDIGLPAPIRGLLECFFARESD